LRPASAPAPLAFPRAETDGALRDMEEKGWSDVK
jgi:hypothetical protein